MEIEPTTITASDTDAEGEALRAAAVKQDTQGAPPESTPASTSTQPDPAQRAAGDEKPPTTEVTKTDNADASSDPPRDAQGRFTKADGSLSAPNEQAPAKTESDYSRAKKDRERNDRSWQALDQEKAQFRAEREAWERQNKAPQRAPELRPAPGMEFTSVQLDKAAKDFEKDAIADRESGDHASAAENFALAAKARTAAEQARRLEHEHQTKEHQTQFSTQWTTNMKGCIEQNPDLGNPESPMAKTVMDLFKTDPIFSNIPDGFQKAAQIAQWKLGSERASALEEEVKSLKAQLEKEQGKTQPFVATGATHVSRTAKRFEDMTEAEQEQHLRGAAEREGAIHKG
jgi:hypothetical protein